VLGYGARIRGRMSGKKLAIRPQAFVSYSDVDSDLVCWLISLIWQSVSGVGIVGSNGVRSTAG
jgi:hypothetical protein